jgi:hypothetical protein
VVTSPYPDVESRSRCSAGLKMARRSPLHRAFPAGKEFKTVEPVAKALIP